MNKSAFVKAAAAAVLFAAAPASGQMVGTVGANPGQSPSDARELDQKFDELRNQGSLDNPNADPEKELETGASLVKQSKFSEALPHLEFYVSKHPKDVTALIYLGFSHRMIGSTEVGINPGDEYRKALDCYRRAQALDPDNRLLHEYAGKVLMLMHDVPDAQVELTALRKACPSGCPERQALEAVVPAQ